MTPPRFELRTRMPYAVEVEGLSKRYGTVEAVSEVSFTVAEGEAFGYLGPNGAGKTTTIRCLLGLIAPSAGAMRVFGYDVRAQLPEVLARVGYLPGEFGLWPSMTGRETLAYLAELHPRPPVRREELRERFELGEGDLDRQVRFYSRGMKQKLGIIQALQHDPPLLVLDEPTEGLDPVMKDRFVSLLREHGARGGTTFISSHILSEVEMTANRVGIVKQGRLVKVGSTQDLSGERVRRCSLVLREPAPPGLLDVPGVSALSGTDGTMLRFELRGDMGPLLARLARVPVVELLVEPESLTDAFFEVYGER